MKRIEITIKSSDEMERSENQPAAAEFALLLGTFAYWLFWFFLAYHFSIFVVLVPFALSVFHGLARGYHPIRYR